MPKKDDARGDRDAGKRQIEAEAGMLARSAHYLIEHPNWPRFVQYLHDHPAELLAACDIVDIRDLL